MNIHVKKMFQREAGYFYSESNFNEVFYMFDLLTSLDCPEPALSGLGERLAYTLQKISQEKLDRQDMITLFPIIWGKFEIYAKLLLYVVDRQEFMRFDLQKLSLRVLLEYYGFSNLTGWITSSGSRKNQELAIQKVYRLRNSEAHECEFWSNRELYDSLAKTFAAYLIITASQLDNLYALKDQIWEETGLRLQKPEFSVVTNINVLEQPFAELFLFSDINKKFKRISSNQYILEFDSTGRIIKSTWFYKDDTSYTDEYTYHKSGGSLFCSIKGQMDEQATRELQYIYDSNGNFIKKYEAANQYTLGDDRIISVDYEPDGSVTIQKYREKVRDRTVNKNHVLLRFDSQGKLQFVMRNGKLDKRFIYEGTKLTEIKDSRGCRYLVKSLGESFGVYFYEDDFDKEGRLCECWHYKDGNLVSIDYPGYTEKHLWGDEIIESQTIRFEYW